jgi:hypothetical protein
MAHEIQLTFSRTFHYICHMRITLEIDDQLLRQATDRATDHGIPLDKFIEDSLRMYLAGRRTTAESRAVQLHTVWGSTQPGIDLSNSADLLERMEQDCDVANRR